MSFPASNNFKKYLLAIVELESNIPAAYRRYWHNPDWLPGVEAIGYIHDGGSYWIAAFTEHGSLFKSYSPDEENDFGLIFPNDLPAWAKAIYEHDLWNAQETTSLMYGTLPGIWVEPWLAKAWWPLDGLHMALPFTQDTFETWLTSLGLDDSDNSKWIAVKQHWMQVYREPELEWEAVDLTEEEKNMHSSSEPSCNCNH